MNLLNLLNLIVRNPAMPNPVRYVPNTEQKQTIILVVCPMQSYLMDK